MDAGNRLFVSLFASIYKQTRRQKMSRTWNNIDISNTELCVINYIISFPSTRKEKSAKFERNINKLPILKQ